jgi:geranylgeranyl pyrophosphate synthase/predicted secreted hydrolase
MCKIEEEKQLHTAHSKIPAKSLTCRDESPHLESPLEWWYVHGWLDGPDFSSRPFMISCLRHNLCGDEDAYSLLISIKDITRAKNHTETRVTRSLIDQILRKCDSIEALNLDQYHVKSYLSEMRQQGPPREISLTPNDTDMQSSPLRIQWNDYSLQQSDEEFILTFQDPSSSNLICLRLRPLKNPVDLKRCFYTKNSKSKMDYVSYLRMDIEGDIDGTPVSGIGWFDHQWGNHNWVQSIKKTRKVMGWDFFGFVLDDFTEFALLIHRDGVSKKVHEQAFIKIDSKGKIHTTTRFSAQPIRFWESPKSAIQHPVEWEINVPEWNIQFTFFPDFDEQEIPVFGLQRSIWQGSGRASGSWNGQTFSAPARGEFQGYGFISDYKTFLKNMADRIDRHIADFLPKRLDNSKLESFLGAPTWEYEPAAYQKMLSDPVWELISRKGKRWRPIFAILLLDALGTPPQPYEALVSTLAELSHSGSLIIDDIQDASVLRRGGKSIHILYGQDVAISAANTLYFLCTHLLFGHPHLTRDQQLDIHEVVMSQFTRAHFGQAQDLFWSKDLSSENLKIWMSDSIERKILQMYELKTASPVQGLAAAAAIIHGGNPKIKAACVRFARDLGVAYQIIDDIHNFSRSPKWRKEPAEDISEGKITYVIIKAISALDSRRSQRLIKILTTPKLRRQQDLKNEAATLVRDSGVFSSCRENAVSMMETEWKNLSQHLEASQAKILLGSMIGTLIQSDFNETEEQKEG